MPSGRWLWATALVTETGLLGFVAHALLRGEASAPWAVVVALGIALFLIVITPIFHGFWAVPPEQVQMQQINFMKNVAILGGLLMVFAFGPGRYSIDRG